MRFIPSQIPLAAPHSLIASMVYAEQVGECLQLLPNKGDNIHWYIFTNPIRNLLSNFTPGKNRQKLRACNSLPAMCGDDFQIYWEEKNPPVFFIWMKI